jgi:hypothetical protein
MSKNRLLFIGLLILLGGLFFSVNCFGAPKADLWPRWQKHDPESFAVVDHVDWDLILKRYVSTDHPSGISRFRYSKVSEKDRKLLKKYLEMMQGTKVSGLNRTEQKAYWINLYNAKTIDLVLDHYPVKSIRDIKIPGKFSLGGPWDIKLLIIEEEELSLNDIEHRILRPIWQDNRVHYAVNCASIGCPNLQPMAYTSINLELLLDKGAVEYINHPRGVSFAPQWLMVSSIYKWFQDDFGGSEKGVILHLREYLTPERQKQLDELKSKFIAHKYDWNLNE